MNLTDSEKIIGALKLFFQPKDVFEIRVLDAYTRAYARPHIESGYFDFEHIECVPSALSHIKYAKGFYVTVNPVRNELLSRAANRVRPAGREPTTADCDVLRRRWLLVDCDAKRASGIPSSGSEHELAYKKALEIRDGFKSMGWAEPIITDSGNGAQLMYRIDIPTTDGGLVHEVLRNISVVSSDSVDIDITVHNPARIWRLPGTMNCKGDSTEERPHRMAQILSTPTDMGIVSEEQLRGACAPVEVKHEPVSDYSGQSDFNIDAWIAEHCSGISGPESWKDGRKWVFDVCPFNSDHTNKSAVITQQANGAIGFMCHHKGCTGHDWKALRNLLESGCEVHNIETFGVDLSQFFEKIKAKKSKKENPFEDPGAFPDKLLSVPGIVDDIINIDLATAPYPNRVLAFSGALAMVAHLVGRKVRDRRNNFTNIYLIALANSGSGKNHPRVVNSEIGIAANIQHSIADSFVSGAGLEDSMFACPAQLFQMDEIDWLFNTLKSSKDAAMSESINEKLLKFYSSSNSIYYMRKKALNPAEMKKENSGYITRPCLTLFGTAVPTYFYESLSRRVLENGLVARCILIEADKRGRHGNPGVISSSLTKEFCEKIEHLASMSMNENLIGVPSPYEIQETPAATDLFASYCEECDNRYDGFEKLREISAMALWARVMEKVYKLAMIYAVSENPVNPVMDVASVRWAFSFVSYATQRMLFRAGQFCYESKNDQMQKRFMKVLHDSGGCMSHSDIMRKLHLSKREMTEVVESLIESETIKKDYIVDSKRSCFTYTEL